MFATNSIATTSQTVATQTEQTLATITEVAEKTSAAQFGLQNFLPPE